MTTRLSGGRRTLLEFSATVLEAAALPSAQREAAADDRRAHA
jgi:hypothetical protein